MAKQNTATVWFQRSDGQKFEVNEGTDAFKAMASNSSFTRLAGPPETAKSEEGKPNGKTQHGRSDKPAASNDR